MEDLSLKALAQHIKSVRIPEPGDKIYKEECVYSFDTPVSCLSSPDVCY